MTPRPAPEVTDDIEQLEGIAYCNWCCEFVEFHRPGHPLDPRSENLL